jgi:hypothetical protein
MPEMKAPQFLSDLYWDLRDRRLLPLVALVLIAIVAVPFLLARSGEEESAPRRPVTIGAGGAAAGARSSSLIAVQAKPGLRDYHKRLGHRRPTDPFEQRFTGPQLAGTELQRDGSSTSTTTTTTTTDNNTTTTTTTTDETRGSGGGAPPPGSSLRLYTFAADVKIVRSETKPSGKVVHGKPTVKHRVVAPEALPSKKAPAVVYMGVDKHHKPLLLVTDAVLGIFGDAQCVAGSSVCQLLEVEKGIPTTFVYGQGGKVRYKITVTKVKAIHVGKFDSTGE